MGSHSNIDALVLHASEPCVLLVRQGDDWVLPRFTFDGQVFADVQRVSDAAQDRLGGRLSTLGYVRYRFEDVRSGDDWERRVEASYALESRDPGWRPATGQRWFDREALRELGERQDAELLDGVLAELESGSTPELRPPWMARGWREQAENWISSSLDELGIGATGPVEHVKSWSISCVLRVPTESGPLYFKTTAPALPQADEARILRELARSYSIPAPLAVESERGWMLLPDFGRELGEDDTEELLRALSEFAALQVRLADDPERLFGFGCMDDRPGALAPRVEALFENDVALGFLEPELRRELLARAPLLHEKRERLAVLGPPPTLVHGDLYPGNMAGSKGDPILFDWTDAAVSHPFVDFQWIHRLPSGSFRERCREACMAPWREGCDAAELDEAWSLSHVVSVLTGLMRVAECLVRMEPRTRDDLAWQVPHGARHLVECLKEQ